MVSLLLSNATISSLMISSSSSLPSPTKMVVYGTRFKLEKVSHKNLPSPYN